VRESRIKDLPMGHRPLEVIWRKRRYRCPEPRCGQRVFTERSAQLPPRRRLTERLRVRLEQAASHSARALSDVAAEYGVSWWSVQRALLVAAVDRAKVAPPPVRMLGLDETRARSLRWTWAKGAGWRLSNPWMTSFVDLDVGRPGWQLGLVPGRSGAAVQTWITAQDPAWRDGIEVVALDPSAPFAAAIRRLLPQATIVVDHWHLVRLAKQAVTEVRQRIARQQYRPPWPQDRSGLGAPAAAAVRRRPALRPRAGSAAAGAGRRRPDERDRRRLGCEGAAPPAARIADAA